MVPDPLQYPRDGPPAWLPRGELQRLLDGLAQAGYRCLGPQVHDGTIQYLPLRAAAELPAGVGDQQAPGSYRLAAGQGQRLFAWANGPQALKPLTFAPEEPVWRALRRDGELHFEPVVPAPVPTAVLGVRACDLAALRLQEAHFLDGLLADPAFRARRDALLLVGVDCTHPADTCFCAATGDGPGLRDGFDIGMSELDDGFLLRAGTPRGAAVVQALALPVATAAQQASAARQRDLAAQRQTRRLPPEDLRARLFGRLDHPQWERVAERCLACGNCTAVCPTCFCAAYSARPELDGAQATQWRSWDSCFSHGHSALHGRPVRGEISQRYRQWLTHKLAGWFDQYGRSGCVGCGRCITWCPVGIDLTAEVAAVVEGEVP
jgi:ferredoxin